MPLYEYECAKCRQVTEIMQKVNDPAPRTCACGAKGALHKIMSRTSFVLKGTGWYVTDFRDNGKKNPASAPGQAGAGPEKGNGGNGGDGKEAGKDNGKDKDQTSEKKAAAPGSETKNSEAAPSPKEEAGKPKDPHGPKPSAA